MMHLDPATQGGYLLVYSCLNLGLLCGGPESLVWQVCKAVIDQNHSMTVHFIVHTSDTMFLTVSDQ